MFLFRGSNTQTGAAMSPVDHAVVDEDGDDGAIFANGGPRSRRRKTGEADDIDSAIVHPGSVRINVKGAFIVDPNATPPNGRASPTSHETSDIRLPNHTATVSHIAVDVSWEPSNRNATPRS